MFWFAGRTADWIRLDGENFAIVFGGDKIVFYEKPFRKFDRILMSVLQTYPQSYKVFRESMITWMIDKLWVGSKISAELGIPTEKILYAEHHMSHAASAFLCSPFEEAAIMTVDGVGEWVTGTWGVIWSATNPFAAGSGSPPPSGPPSGSRASGRRPCTAPMHA